MSAGERAEAVVQVFDGDVVVATFPIAGLARPDLCVVDALARLQLAAVRCGCSIRLRDASEELCGLLELVGLADVIPGAPGLSLEAGGETEGSEELGVQEVVPPRDAPA
ncbi:MAG: hypothetical protein LC733_09710 [Actinobacteria bacterium]|nr:hypothetical protein [Actinomycetota bacterium]